MPTFEQSEKAGKEILRMLSGESTPQQAESVIKQMMARCDVGAHGVCQTHGQVIDDCKKQGLR